MTTLYLLHAYYDVLVSEVLQQPCPQTFLVTQVVEIDCLWDPVGQIVDVYRGILWREVLSVELQVGFLYESQRELRGVSLVVAHCLALGLRVEG